METHIAGVYCNMLSEDCELCEVSSSMNVGVVFLCVYIGLFNITSVVSNLTVFVVFELRTSQFAVVQFS